MLGTIERIDNTTITLKLNVDIKSIENLINLYVLIQDNNNSFIGEILNVNNDYAVISLLGEYKNNDFIYGVVKKPSFYAKVDLISPKYIGNIISYNSNNENNLLYLGTNPYYENAKINALINNFFGAHFAVFGATGSGKSCSLARILQNLFKKNNISNKMNIVLFDTYGEYTNAFNYLNDKYDMAFKTYTTNIKSNEEKLNIPPWFLGIDDYAILLDAQNRTQMPIIEKALRNVNIFMRPEEEVIKYKNSIIASALLDILLSGRPASQIRDQFFSALSRFYTKDLNLESSINQPGYFRTLKQCLLIDEHGKINAIELITSFLQDFITNEVCSALPDGSYMYTLDDFASALDFALIDEGVWKSDKIFDMANVLKVRLASLLNSDNKQFFEYPTYISKSDYIRKIFTTTNNKKAQLINFNINYIDERFAKSIVKIYSKLMFDYAKLLDDRASNPFNIILEEAHRYVQNNDNDINTIGYNIFERIAKEGRKYGVLLGLISQRPCELSETCLSQCNNFLLFKMSHPHDLEYVAKVVPNITEEIIEKVKSLQPGNSISFGSAFKMPILINYEMPNPAPNSDNSNLSNIWFN